MSGKKKEKKKKEKKIPLRSFSLRRYPLRVLLTTTFVYDCRFRCLAAQAVSTSTIARKSSLKELFSQLNLESD